jgi:hypothetical protein
MYSLKDKEKITLSGNPFWCCAVWFDNIQSRTPRIIKPRQLTIHPDSLIENIHNIERYPLKRMIYGVPLEYVFISRVESVCKNEFMILLEKAKRDIKDKTYINICVLTNKKDEYISIIDEIIMSIAKESISQKVDK